MRFPGRLPSAPPSEPALRRLGVRSSSQLERPIRGQTIVATAVAVLLIALPLYWLRRPKGQSSEANTENLPTTFQPSVPAAPPADERDGRLALGPVERVRCGPSPGAVGQSGRLCDALPFFEKSLAEAIENSVDCAPRTREGGTLNYVLKIDFAQKQLHVFPGASGAWRGPQARHATKCVKQGLKAPEWEKIEHQYRYYEIAILATYKAPSAAPGPLFD